MKKTIILILYFLFLFVSCENSAKQKGILSPVPEGAQAISLMGESLFSAPPDTRASANCENAKAEYFIDTTNATTLIWYGRWTAYKGDYREAIRLYTSGINKFPEDARFYRHRGHRYISIREFDRAIKDFKIASNLCKNKKDMVEPDGMPNALNIPISSLQSNIWYHLGLSYYLVNDLRNAEKIYRIAVETSNNDDKLVSTTHWLYMILRLRGKDKEALKVLEPINKDLNIIENMAYHKLCLFYKGVITMEEITGKNFTDIMNDAVLYGLANWYYYNENVEKAKDGLERILKKDSWASFGYIAAEADYLRNY